MNKKYKLYKLKFISPFHISSGGFALEKAEYNIRSDTLFSAICSVSNLLYEDKAINEFLKNESVFISSAFPYYNDELLFPKPATFHYETKNYSEQKKIKKLEYISKDIFEKYINNTLSGFVLNAENIIQKSYVNKKLKNDDFIYKYAELPRVVIDRITNQTTIFHFAEYSFNKNCGLYFIAEFNNSDSEKFFDASLSLLGDEGIGADRTVGKGLFFNEKDFVELEVPENSDYLMNLSLYIPSENEFSNIDFKSSSYDFITRSGWISLPGYNSLRRKSFRMIKEGSVMKLKNQLDLKGINCVSYEDSDSDFKAYRYGKSLTIPFKFN